MRRSKTVDEGKQIKDVKTVPRDSEDLSKDLVAAGVRFRPRPWFEPIGCRIPRILKAQQDKEKVERRYRRSPTPTPEDVFDFVGYTRLCRRRSGDLEQTAQDQRKMGNRTRPEEH